MKQTLLVLVLGLLIYGCGGSTLSTSKDLDGDREEQLESEADKSEDGDEEVTNENENEADESEGYEAEIEETETSESDSEQTEEESEESCEPGTSWCVENVLHSCDDNGDEYAPRDCGTDTCFENTCRPEWALEFNGYGWVDLGPNYFVMNSATFTIETWVRWISPDPEGADHQIVYGEGESTHLALVVKDDGSVMFSIARTTGWNEAITKPVMQDNQWHHIAVVKTTGILVFVDGHLEATTELTGDAPAPLSDPLAYLGCNSTPAKVHGSKLNGVIDELRISSAARYTSDFTPVSRYESDTDTLALWHLDEGGGRATTDAANRLVGTLSGGVNWVAGKR